MTQINTDIFAFVIKPFIRVIRVIRVIRDPDSFTLAFGEIYNFDRG
jgi:hypothetical protein